jgi:hypothetical protein
MGWGRYLLLGDLGQQLDLADQKAEIDQMREEMRRSRSSDSGASGLLEHVQAENDELRLYLAAVIRILISKRIVTKEEMARIIDAVDASDGTADGRFTGDLRGN